MARARIRSFKYTVKANDVLVAELAGDTITCFESNGELQIEFDDEGGSTEFSKGITYPEDAFEKIKLINNTGADISVKIGVGQGKIRDGRLAVVGALNVQNVAGTSLSITNSSLSELFHIRNGVNSVSSRLSKTSYARFTNVSSVEVTNVTTEVVTAAENTHGLYIYNLCISGRSGISSVKIGGHTIYKSSAHSGASDTLVWPMVIYVPSGKSIELSTNNTSSTICMSYELLS